MKTHRIAVLIAFLVAGCNAQHEEPSPLVVKKLIAKESAIEKRLSVDFFAKESVKNRATTVYYLVAEDGDVIEVGLSEYSTAKIGSTYAAESHQWKRK